MISRQRSTLLLPVFGWLKLVVAVVTQQLWALPMAAAAPALSSAAGRIMLSTLEEDLPMDPDSSELWMYLGTAAALVLLGGAFAGLTIALMGQDEIYLQVIATSGEGAEKVHAQRVLDLLNRGKHWVLVTLLLSNVITNETLPIVLDRSLGGGWPAVLGSTVLIVIFGEIAPQSVCVRYGLPIGAAMSPYVLILMWILSPVAWPTAKLLDYLLGEDHGTTYKKAGLKTLVTLHRTLGTGTDERLTKDEVTIISAVLDLKEKTVGSIMTPMDDVFTLSMDAVLDEDMMNRILEEGYSRIPIHSIDCETNFVGMLLVKMLITYDPEDCMRVRDFPLATLPETRADTSCLDIINFFQEGKSHMILVSENPGEASGALGVVTLEDVIEELIGEEIIDESDVFIDVHKAIRRLHPAPRFRVPKGEIVEPKQTKEVADMAEGDIDDLNALAKSHTQGSTGVILGTRSPAGSRKASMNDAEGRHSASFLLRRRSSGHTEPFTVRGATPEMMQHLKHLGPSNMASRPKPTQIKSVKIKPGVGQMAPVPETKQLQVDGRRPPSRAQSLIIPSAATSDERTSLLSQVAGASNPIDTTRRSVLSPGRTASDGVHALGYGAIVPASPTAKSTNLPTNFAPSSVRSADGFMGGLGSRMPVTVSPPTSPKSQTSVIEQPLINVEEPEGTVINIESPDSSTQPSSTKIAISSSGSDPSRQPNIRLEIQSSTQDPLAESSSSQKGTSRGNSQERDADGGLVAPHKLVIELERPNSRGSLQSGNESVDTVASLRSFTPSNNGQDGAVKPAKSSVAARSGSITEQVINIGGLKKVILETQPSSSDDELDKENASSTADSTTRATKDSGGVKPTLESSSGNNTASSSKTIIAEDEGAEDEDEEEEGQEHNGVQLPSTESGHDAAQKKKGAKAKRSKKKSKAKKTGTSAATVSGT